MEERGEVRNMSEERDSFVFYPTFYIEAGDGISLKSAYRMNNAITRYGIFGELPDTAGWRQWERIIVNAAIAQIAAQKEKRDNGKKGGRAEKTVSIEEINEKYAELGNWDSVADFFGISRRTLFNIKREQATPRLDEEQVQNAVQAEVQIALQEVQSAKTNVNVKENVNENVNEKEDGAQSAPVAAKPPALLGPENLSQNSVLFPTGQAAGSSQRAEQPQEKQKRQKSDAFVAPAVEEVAAYCNERNNGIDAESFVAFYASKGWFVGKNKMKDWRQAVITWEKRAREQAQNSARASPAVESRESSGWNAAHTVL